METLHVLMTATFFPPYHLGGDATHVAMLAEELVRRGHEVTVIHSVDAYALKRGRAEPPSKGPALDGLTTIPLRSTIGRASPLLTYLTGRNRLAARTFERALRELRPDLVHHHNISLLGGELLQDRGAPSMYTAHDYWLICPRSDLMYRGRESCDRLRCTRCALLTRRPPQLWRGREWRDSLQSLASVISPSRFLSGRLQHFLRLESTVLPNFAPRPPTRPAAIPDPGHFMFIGVLERHKGLELLLDAYRRRNITTKLKVVGKGSLEAKVRQVSAEMPDLVQYEGYVPEERKMELLSGAKALLAPSIWNENSPLTCIEALSMGTPLIVSDHGGLPELVSEEACGLIAEASAEGLEKAMLKLEDGGGLREELSRNALIRYERHHSPESYMKRYLDLAGVVMAE